MKKWGIALIATLCVASALAVACGGGGDDDNGDETTTSGTRTATRTARTGTPGAEGTGTPGTPGAEGTAGATDGTAASGTATNPQSTPVPGTTPAAGQSPAGATPAPGATQAAVDPSTPPTPTDDERSVTGEVDEEVTGGNPNDPPEVVTDLPPVPPNATIDPATVAPPNATASGIEFIIDTNASEPGIQSSRSVKVGDVFRVGVVVTNIPAGNEAGLAGFGFEMLYDYTKMIAPTIEGGSGAGRNPDFNDAQLGGGLAGWFCLAPAPVGDADEPGSFVGDGDPATGQAMIACAQPGAAPQSGTLVLATVQFQAVATGSVTLSLSDSSNTVLYDVGFGVSMGDCGFQTSVPCRTATINVTN